MELVASPIKLKTWFLTAPVELNTLDSSEIELCQSVSDYAVHKYRVNDLVKVQKLDVTIDILKLLMDGQVRPQLPCEGGIGTKIRGNYYKLRGHFYVSKQGVLMRIRKANEATIGRDDVIILPQLFHLEVLQLAHDHQAHVGQHRVIGAIWQKFDWPGLHKDAAKYINSCLVCQARKYPKKRMKYPLKPLQSGGPNELLQVDHLRLTNTKEEKKGVLMITNCYKWTT